MRLGLTVLLLLASAPAPAATPEEREQARRQYESAMRKYDTGRYEEAAVDFEHVFDLIGDPALLFNIAQSYRGAQRFDKALLFYRSFNRRMPEAAARMQVDQRIAELTEVLKRPPPEPTDKPPAPVVAPPTSAPPSGLATTVSPSAVTVAEAPVATPRDRRPLRRAGIALAAVGVAALVAGGALSGLTISSSNQISNASTNRAEYTSGLDGTYALGQTAQSASIAMYAVGGVAAAAGVGLLVVGYKPERRTSLAIGPSSLWLQGRF